LLLRTGLRYNLVGVDLAGSCFLPEGGGLSLTNSYLSSASHHVMVRNKFSLSRSWVEWGRLLIDKTEAAGTLYRVKSPEKIPAHARDTLRIFKQCNGQLFFP
jgi:hypothetical protein